MPIQVVRDDFRRVMIATASGSLSLEELLAFFARERSGPTRGYALLFDARDATTDAVSEGVRRLVDRAASLRHAEGPGGRVAIVTSEPTLFGMARMFQTLCEQAGIVDSISVCRTLEDAERWLALDRPTSTKPA